eukprot:m.179041 g.179041  ORF g.179041 m.179041 type:complete len:2555 (-) comp14640_c4_seq6:98-7762(-)
MASQPKEALFPLSGLENPMNKHQVLNHILRRLPPVTHPDKVFQSNFISKESLAKLRRFLTQQGHDITAAITSDTPDIATVRRCVYRVTQLQHIDATCKLKGWESDVEKGVKACLERANLACQELFSTTVMAQLPNCVERMATEITVAFHVYTAVSSDALAECFRIFLVQLTDRVDLAARAVEVYHEGFANAPRSTSDSCAQCISWTKVQLVYDCLISLSAVLASTSQSLMTSGYAHSADPMLAMIDHHSKMCHASLKRLEDRHLAVRKSLSDTLSQMFGNPAPQNPSGFVQVVEQTISLLHATPQSLSFAVLEDLNYLVFMSKSHVKQSLQTLGQLADPSKRPHNLHAPAAHSSFYTSLLLEEGQTMRNVCGLDMFDASVATLQNILGSFKQALSAFSSQVPSSEAHPTFVTFAQLDTILSAFLTHSSFVPYLQEPWNEVCTAVRNRVTGSAEAAKKLLVHSFGRGERSDATAAQLVSLVSTLYHAKHCLSDTLVYNQEAEAVADVIAETVSTLSANIDRMSKSPDFCDQAGQVVNRINCLGDLHPLGTYTGLDAATPAINDAATNVEQALNAMQARLFNVYESVEAFAPSDTYTTPISDGNGHDAQDELGTAPPGAQAPTQADAELPDAMKLRQLLEAYQTLCSSTLLWFQDRSKKALAALKLQVTQRASTVANQLGPLLEEATLSLKQFQVAEPTVQERFVAVATIVSGYTALKPVAPNECVSLSRFWPNQDFEGELKRFLTHVNTNARDNGIAQLLAALGTVNTLSGVLALEDQRSAIEQKISDLKADKKLSISTWLDPQSPKLSAFAASLPLVGFDDSSIALFQQQVIRAVSSWHKYLSKFARKAMFDMVLDKMCEALETTASIIASVAKPEFSVFMGDKKTDFIQGVANLVPILTKMVHRISKATKSAIEDNRKIEVANTLLQMTARASQTLNEEQFLQGLSCLPIFDTSDGPIGRLDSSSSQGSQQGARTASTPANGSPKIAASATVAASADEAEEERPVGTVSEAELLQTQVTVCVWQAEGETLSEFAARIHRALLDSFKAGIKRKVLHLELKDNTELKQNMPYMTRLDALEPSNFHAALLRASNGAKTPWSQFLSEQATEIILVLTKAMVFTNEFLDHPDCSTHMQRGLLFALNTRMPTLPVEVSSEFKALVTNKLFQAEERVREEDRLLEHMGNTDLDTFVCMFEREVASAMKHHSSLKRLADNIRSRILQWLRHMNEAITKRVPIRVVLNDLLKQHSVIRSFLVAFYQMQLDENVRRGFGAIVRKRAALPLAWLSDNGVGFKIKSRCSSFFHQRGYLLPLDDIQVERRYKEVLAAAADYFEEVVKRWKDTDTGTANIVDQMHSSFLFLRLADNNAVCRMMDSQGNRCTEACIRYVRTLDSLIARALTTYPQLLAAEDPDMKQINAALDIAQALGNGEVFHSFSILLSTQARLVPECTKVKSKLLGSLNYDRVRQDVSKALKDWEALCDVSFVNDRTSLMDAVGRNEYFADLGRAYSGLRLAELVRNHCLCERNQEQTEQVFLHNLADVLVKIRDAVKQIPETVVDYDRATMLADILRAFHGEFRKRYMVTGSLVTHCERVQQQVAKHITGIVRRSADSVTQPQDFLPTLISIKEAAIHLPLFKSRIDGVIDGMISKFKTNFGRDEWAKMGSVIQKQLNEGQGDQQATFNALMEDHAEFAGFRFAERNRLTGQYSADAVLGDIEVGDGAYVKIAHPGQKALKRLHDKVQDAYSSLVDKSLEQPELEDALNDVVRSTHGFLNQISGSRTVMNTITAPNVAVLIGRVFAYWTIAQSKHYRTEHHRLKALLVDGQQAHDDGEAASDPPHEADDRSLTQAQIEDSKNFLVQPHAVQIFAILRLLGLDQASSVRTIPKHLIQIGTGEGKSIVLAVSSIVLSLIGYDVDCACYSEYLSERDFCAFKYMFDAFSVTENVRYGTFNQLCEFYINEKGDVRKCVNDFVSGTVQAPPEAPIQVRPRIVLIDEVDVFFKADFYGNAYNPVSSFRHPSLIEFAQYLWDNRAQVPRFSNAKRAPKFQALLESFPEWSDLFLNALSGMLYDLKTLADAPPHIVSNGKIGYKEQDGISFNTRFGYKTMFSHFAEYERGLITRSTRDAAVSINIRCGSYSYAEIPKHYASILGVTGTLRSLCQEEQALLKDAYNIQCHTLMPSAYNVRSQLKFTDDTNDVQVCSKTRHFETIGHEINQRFRDGKRAILVFFENARQGDPGSFSLVIADTYLERYGIEPKDVESSIANRFRDVIDRKRQAYYSREFPKTLEHVGTIGEKHDESVQMLQWLQQSTNLQAVKEMLLKGNCYAQAEAGYSRTIIMLDATGSMSSLIKHAKRMLSQLFSIAQSMLSAVRSTKGFELQFGVYRNYNVREEQILQVSQWSANPDDLQPFLDSISVRGGLGREAIELALRHAANETERDHVDQVLLLGDMPPNKRDEVVSKRKNSSYDWDASQYPITYWEDELARLKEDGVLINAFYLDDDRAKQDFEHMAHETGGISKFIDLGKDQAEHELVDLVLRQVLAVTDQAALQHYERLHAAQ